LTYVLTDVLEQGLLLGRALNDHLSL